MKDIQPLFEVGDKVNVRITITDIIPVRWGDETIDLLYELNGAADLRLTTEELENLLESQ